LQKLCLKHCCLPPESTFAATLVVLLRWQGTLFLTCGRGCVRAAGTYERNYHIEKLQS